jgi:hypothetical protein
MSSSRLTSGARVFRWGKTLLIKRGAWIIIRYRFCQSRDRRLRPAHGMEAAARLGCRRRSPVNGKAHFGVDSMRCPSYVCGRGALTESPGSASHGRRKGACRRAPPSLISPRTVQSVSSSDGECPAVEGEHGCETGISQTLHRTVVLHRRRWFDSGAIDRARRRLTRVCASCARPGPGFSARARSTPGAGRKTLGETGTYITILRGDFVTLRFNEITFSEIWS